MDLLLDDVDLDVDPGSDRLTRDDDHALARPPPPGAPSQLLHHSSRKTPARVEVR